MNETKIRSVMIKSNFFEKVGGASSSKRRPRRPGNRAGAVAADSGIRWRRIPTTDETVKLRFFEKPTSSKQTWEQMWNKPKFWLPYPSSSFQRWAHFFKLIIFPSHNIYQIFWKKIATFKDLLKISKDFFTIFIETFKVHNFQCKLSQTNEQMRIRWDAESILKGNLLANIHLLMAMVDHYTRAGEL